MKVEDSSLNVNERSVLELLYLFIFQYLFCQTHSCIISSVSFNKKRIFEIKTIKLWIKEQSYI